MWKVSQIFFDFIDFMLGRVFFFLVDFFHVFKSVFFKPVLSTYSVIHEFIGVVFNLLLKMADDYGHLNKHNGAVLLTQFNELRDDVEVLALKTLYDIQIPVCDVLRQLPLKDCFKLIVSVIFP